MVSTGLLAEEQEKVGIWFVHIPTTHPLILRLYKLMYEPTFVKSKNSLCLTFADPIIASK